MPSHNLASHTCTSFQFLRIGDGDACAAGHRELEQRNTPAGACQIHDKGQRRQRLGDRAAQASYSKHTCPGRPAAETFGDAFGTLVAGD